MFDGNDVDLTALINIAARQRMLAHRIVMLGLLKSSEKDMDFSKDMEISRRLFIESHRLIMQRHGALPLRDSAKASSQVLAPVISFLKWVESCAAGEESALSNGTLLCQVNAVLGGFVSGINAIIADFEEAVRAESRNQSAQTQNARDAICDIADELKNISSKIQRIALNARIEAARQGRQGAAFGVIANEIQGLSSLARGKAEALYVHLGAAQ